MWELVESTAVLQIFRGTLDLSSGLVYMNGSSGIAKLNHITWSTFGFMGNIIIGNASINQLITGGPHIVRKLPIPTFDSLRVAIFMGRSAGRSVRKKIFQPHLSGFIGGWLSWFSKLAGIWVRPVGPNMSKQRSHIVLDHKSILNTVTHCC